MKANVNATTIKSPPSNVIGICSTVAPIRELLYKLSSNPSPNTDI